MYTGEWDHRKPFSKRIAKKKGTFKAFVWDNRFDTRKGYPKPVDHVSRFAAGRKKFPQRPYQVYVVQGYQKQFPSHINSAMVMYYETWEDAVSAAARAIRELEAGNDK